MENADFLGIYTARDAALKSLFPEENECGLWQAWKMPDDGYIVQPVDGQRQPTGGLSMMSAQDFQDALSPLPSDEAIIRLGRCFLRADALDLLDMWYERSKADASRGERKKEAVQPRKAERPLLTEELPRSGTKPQGAESSPGPETPSTPAEELDAAYLEALDEVRKHLALVEAEGGASSVGQGLEARHGALPPLFGDAEQSLKNSAPQPLAEADVQNTDPDEERAAALELSMRDKFSALMGQLDESPYPAVEQEVEQLLSRGAGATWKQKYMFSEFGMALRRKGKPRLALIAHERALGLAPGDGHILFNLARSEYELGDIAAARIYLEQALTVLPDFAPARSFLSFLEGQQGGGKEE